MITLKCKLGDTLKRRTVRADLTHLRLSEVVREMFGLATASRIGMRWRDEDDDLITIHTDQDVAEAVRFFLAASKPVMRLEVISEPPLVTHHPSIRPMPCLPHILGCMTHLGAGCSASSATCCQRRGIQVRSSLGWIDERL